MVPPMITPESVHALLAAGLPGATIVVEDPYNDGTHLTARIASPAFRGLNRVQQHKMVYAALGNAFAEDLHALQITTTAE